ncbi:hypothetical protein [Roseovarius sp. D22-M7]|uniref:hypothetical protein n=1 Tax=Roseovarius sp. D22-M7 TaxID=3127116 RepID=UPI003010526D
MKHLIVGAPIFAVTMTAALLFSGAAWWVAVCAFFLTAPVMVGLATFLCNTILPCQYEDRKSPGSESASY